MNNNLHDRACLCAITFSLIKTHNVTYGPPPSLQEMKEPDQTEEASQEGSQGKISPVFSVNHEWDLSMYRGVDD